MTMSEVAMSRTHAPFVVLDVGCPHREWSYWLCAAALEPGLTTWVGTAWGDVMAGQSGCEPTPLSMTLTREMYEFVIQGQHPSTAPHTLRSYLTQQAIEVLHRHGLQPIREKCLWNDDIPL